MGTEANFIAEELFRTEALKPAPAEQPFWYTSGTLGPYFINTHFLFGGAERAGELLAVINEALAGERTELPAKVGALCLKEYAEDPAYKRLIDYACELLAGKSFTAVSGGERRDYFFSYAIAERLGLPHITLFKDLSAVRTEPGLLRPQLLEKGDLAGETVLHVADLVTEASSYLRAWLPALRGLGAKISETLAVVDRSQGGAEILAAEGVKLIALIELDEKFFEQAAAKGQVSAEQVAGILRFREDTHGYMKAFLEAHPDFIRQELAKGGKAEERARRAIAEGLAKAP